MSDPRSSSLTSYPLSTLDPAAPLDDLEPLHEIVGEASVVAIGESAHFVREFRRVQERLTRFLAERCGFSVFAYEFGFSEGLALGPWVAGAGEDAGLPQVSPLAHDWGAGDLLGFLRRQNKLTPLRFAGIDVPEAGGSLLPALDPLQNYLQEVDPEALPLLEGALATARKIAGRSGAWSAPAWARLDRAEQDALTATLARLQLRLRALEPRLVAQGGRERYDVALRRLEAATHADYMSGAMTDLFAGRGREGDLSIRDRFMAESVLWHLERAEPGTRVVLVAHDNHIQKTPMEFGGRLAALPMGHYLQEALGDAYVAIAVTTTADHIPEMALNPATPAGFTVTDTRLPEPEPGSLEAAVEREGRDLTLVDLRDPSPAVRALDRIRSQSSYVLTPVGEAFDAAVVVPTVTMEADLAILQPREESAPSPTVQGDCYTDREEKQP